ncbi:MAG: hypothetical protein JW891_15320 [Candidatus Lokiarchaeota archaeon]|nr:hypothetical protein [Candidatus Lokiarchaeota archaeon]
MARNYLLGLRLVNGIIFIIVLSIFLSVFNYLAILYTDTGELAIVAFIFSIKNVLTYFIFIVIYGIGYMVSFVVTFGQAESIRAVQSFFRTLFSSWFSFSTPTGEAPELENILDEVLEELQIFLSDAYLIIFQVCFIIAIIYAIRAIYKSNPKYNLRSIGGLMLMIIIPIMVFGFKDMMALFGFPIELLVPQLADLPNPVSSSVNELPIDDFFLFISSSISGLAIFAYIYLELAFQINYTDLVTKPSLERSDRLQAQLRLLKKESTHVIANVDKIKEEAKKRKEELELKKESVGKLFSSTISSSFSYVKEMIEKKKLEAEEKKLVTAASKTRRLGRFIERLFQEDSEAEDTITAKSAAPRAMHLAKSTVINFSIRLMLLIIISFIIIHPEWFLSNIFQLPPAISKSVVLQGSPEGIIILLLPIIVVIPVISLAISYSKHRNLMIRLRQEGKIKQILTTVGDYVKIEEEEKPEEAEKESAEPSLTPESSPEPS